MGGQLSSPTPNLESGQFSGKGDGKGLLMEEIRQTRQLRLVVFPHYLQGCIHPRWCRISSINRMEIVLLNF